MRNKDIEEILNLSPEEEEKIHRVQETFTKRFNAEADKESHLKWRILFERTAPEMLPFVIYCLTFGPVAAYSLSQISSVKGSEFYFLLGILIIIMIIPLFILPRLPFKKWFFKKRGDN